MCPLQKALRLCLNAWMALNAVIYFVAWMLAVQVWNSFKARGEIAHLIQGVRGKHVLLGFCNLILLLVSLFCALYLATKLPALQWSWLQLIGGKGSALTAGATARHTVPTSFVIAMYVLLVLAMPMVVLIEEKMFRRNTEKRSRLMVFIFAVLFGLSHMAIGFPVFAAIAMIATGLFLSLIYLIEWKQDQSPEAATLAAARVHLTSNLLGGMLMSTVFYLTS